MSQSEKQAAALPLTISLTIKPLMLTADTTKHPNNENQRNPGSKID